MTAPARSAAGVAVALGFALLAKRRTGGVAMLCGAQAIVVAIGALAQGDVGVTLVECAEAAVLGWLALLPLPLWKGVGGWGTGRADPTPNTRPLPQPWSASRPKPTRGGGVQIICAGAVLAGLAATIPGTGLPLAVILLGLLLVASRAMPSHQALGIAAMQNGLVLASVTAGLSDWRLALVVLPCLPALACGALWLGSDRARTALLLAPRPAAWIDAALCGLVLLLACALPGSSARTGHSRASTRSPRMSFSCSPPGPPPRVGRAATPPRFGQPACHPDRNRPRHRVQRPAAELARHDARRRRRGCRRFTGPCRGMATAAPGPHRPRPGAVRRRRLARRHGPLPASACVMLGYGTLAVLAPELTVAATALILRMRGASTDDLLLAAGLAALLVAALGLATHAPQRRTLKLVGLAQGGAAVFAFGLGTEGGNLAGLLQLSFLALTQCALLLAREDGLDRLAALAGLAGLPPFGLFPSLALILAATAERLPWLLLPLGAGLAAIAWAVLLQLPAERRLLPSPAWLPLALLLIAGFAMPDPLLAWFRLAAR